MLLSRFLSITSLAGIASLCAAACGPEDHCGPGGAPDDGVVASGTGVTMSFGMFTGSLNNDCPDPAAPAGVVSLSIEGVQSDGQGRVTLCVGRPDQFAKQPLPLGSNSPGTPVQVIDFAGSANGCTFAVDRSATPGGTATSSGLCGNGSDPAGFALMLNGSLRLTRTCGTTVDALPVTLRGRVAVRAPSTTAR